jgi:hypothetical protein
MNSLEYRRVPTRPGLTQANHTQTTSSSFDWLQLIKRISWLASALVLVRRWELYIIPRNMYSVFATLSLISFLTSFSYIVLNIRRQYGYSDFAPPHNRWKHYSPRAVEVMSVSSLMFYGFASFAFYGRLGLLVFPGMAVVCYGSCCMLSYL